MMTTAVTYSQLKSIFSYFGKAQVITCKRFIKRKNPIDRDYEYGLPIYQYPVGSSSDRRVYAWGLSEHGALGNRLQSKSYGKKLPEYHHKPLRLTFAEHNKVIDVACGYGFTLFAVDTKEKIKLFGCGINTDSQVGYHDPHRDHPLGLVVSPAPIDLPLTQGTKVCRVAAGRAHSLVLANDGSVFSLGNNAYGQCGRCIVPEEQYTGSRVVYRLPHLSKSQVTAIHCGMDHSLFLTEDGVLYSCGWGADGQLGLGNFQSQSNPTRVAGDVLHEKITKVVGAGDCVLALNNKGEVFGWGNNEYRQLSEAEDLQQVCTPIQIVNTKALGKIVDIAAGGSFCAVVNEEGAVFVWGWGLLGLGPRVQQSAQPLQIPRTLFGDNVFTQAGSRVTSIAAGLFHLLATTNLGQLYAWGRNKGGCLGLGHINDQYFPLKVNIGAHVLKVAAGVDHTMSLCKPFT